MRAGGGRIPAGFSFQPDKTRLQLFTRFQFAEPSSQPSPRGRRGNSKSPARSGWACDDCEKRDQGRTLFKAIAEFARTPDFPGQRNAGTQTAGRLSFP